MDRRDALKTTSKESLLSYQQTLLAARRLLKSHLRMHLAKTLAEESPQWVAMVELEKALQEEAREGWKRARNQSSWTFDELAAMVGRALSEASIQVAVGFQGIEVKPDDWVDETVDQYVKTFSLLDFLNEAKDEV